ncbi:MAG: hypothetical protein JWR69_83 [Pedosphaera sp.]|nr:hypothetical protein [Pedosphaera sp.]
MNVGFSNLDTLKKHLLAGSLANETKFNTVITALGHGMAAMVASYCNRSFLRTVGAVEILPADRANFLLSRFPLEALTSVELKLSEADGFVVQPATFYQTIDLKNGMVILPDGADAGPYYAQVRFTYTGGYWWETLEPDDVAGGYPSAMPAGATALPHDVIQAWLLQCQHVWDARDKLGMNLADKPGEQAKLAEVKLIPLVETMLTPYTRYNLI